LSKLFFQRGIRRKMGDDAPTNGMCPLSI
jgi:hypothetical protein